MNDAFNALEEFKFQSNAPRAGCNYYQFNHNCSRCHFNLTHPVRGVTSAGLNYLIFVFHFNLTHTVRGVTAKPYNPSVSW